MNKYLIKEIYLLILGINKGVGYFYILISYGIFFLIICIKKFCCCVRYSFNEKKVLIVEFNYIVY